MCIVVVVIYLKPPNISRPVHPVSVVFIISNLFISCSFTVNDSYGEFRIHPESSCYPARVFLSTFLLYVKSPDLCLPNQEGQDEEDTKPRDEKKLLSCCKFGRKKLVKLLLLVR